VEFQIIEDDGQVINSFAPYSKDLQKIVNEPFLNYNKGDRKQSPEFVKSLSMTILQYADYPEQRYEGDIELCITKIKKL
jgi:hypothetical protein